MKILSERKAEDFLEKGGFRVVERKFCSSRIGLRKSLMKIGVPFVLKASGKKLFSKENLSGVKQNVKTYTEALIEFKNLKKIKGSKGVLIQKKINGKEFFVGIKKESDQNFKISLGFFSSEKKEGVFKVFPSVKKRVVKIVKEFGGSLSGKEKYSLEKFIFELIEFIKSNSKIKEIIVGSLIVDGKHSIIVNARIIFD